MKTIQYNERRKTQPTRDERQSSKRGGPFNQMRKENPSNKRRRTHSILDERRDEIFWKRKTRERRRRRGTNTHRESNATQRQERIHKTNKLHNHTNKKCSATKSCEQRVQQSKMNKGIAKQNGTNKPTMEHTNKPTMEPKQSS